MPENIVGQKPFKVHVFGGPWIEAAGKQASVSPAQATLLGIIALHDAGGVSRARLKDLMWDRGTDRELTPRLNQLIHMTRKRLDLRQGLVSDGELLRLDPEIVGTDLDDFHRLLADGDVQGAWDLLEKGVFSATFRASDTAPDAVIRPAASQLRISLSVRAHDMWEAAVSENRWLGAEEAARVLCGLDPQEDTPVLQLLRAVGMQGRFSEATDIYRTYARSMSSPGPWEPSEELRRTMELVDASILPLQMASSDLEQDEATAPFTGRDSELQALRKLLFGPPPKSSRLVAVTGQDGFGKTRLCMEVLQSAPIGGSSILQARCHRIERALPLAAISSALSTPWVRSHVGKMEAPWKEFLMHALPSSTTLELPSFVPEATSISVSRVLFESLRRLFQRLTSDGPLIVFFDDLDNADPTTLQVIAYLIMHSGCEGLTILVSASPVTGRIQSDLDTSVVPALLQWETSHELALRPLSRPDAARLAEHYLSEKHRGAGEEVVGLAGCSPHLVIETARHWDHFADSAAFHPEDLPPTLRGVFRTALNALTPFQTHLLDLICVAGQPLGLNVLHRIADLPNNVLHEELDELTELGFIATTDRGIIPRLEIIRHIVISRRSKATLGSLHHQLATTLASFDEIPAGILAKHFAAASQSTLAHKYSLVAALAARRSGAPEEAIGFLEIARVHAESDSQRRAVVDELGDILHRHRKLEAAISVLSLAEELHISTGDSEKAFMSRLQKIEAETQMTSSSPSEAHHRFQQLFKAAHANGWHKGAARALYYDLRYQRRREGLRQIAKIIREAKSLWEENLEGEARITTSGIIALSAYFADPKDGPPFAEHSRKAAQSLGSRDVLLEALTRCVAVHIATGELNTPLGRSIWTEAENLARDSPDPLQKIKSMINRSVWLLDSGEATASLHALTSAEAPVRRVATAGLSAIYWCNMGIVCIRLRNFIRAEEALRRAREALGDQRHLEIETQIAAGLGVCAMEKGQMTRAGEIMDSISVPTQWYFDPTLAIGFFVRHLVRIGDPKGAHVLLEEAMEHIKKRFPLHWMDLMEQRRIIPSRLQDTCQRKVDFEEALTLAEKLRVPRRAALLRSFLQEPQAS